MSVLEGICRPMPFKSQLLDARLCFKPVYVSGYCLNPRGNVDLSFTIIRCRLLYVRGHILREIPSDTFVQILAHCDKRNESRNRLIWTSYVHMTFMKIHTRILVFYRSQRPSQPWLFWNAVRCLESNIACKAYCDL